MCANLVNSLFMLLQNVSTFCRVCALVTRKDVCQFRLLLFTL